MAQLCHGATLRGADGEQSGDRHSGSARHKHMMLFKKSKTLGGMLVIRSTPEVLLLTAD